MTFNAARIRQEIIRLGWPMLVHSCVRFFSLLALRFWRSCLVSIVFGQNRRVIFHNFNAIKFRSHTKFDLIWSAGLFDYFNDKSFVRLLSRFMTMLTPGGEVVIENFNDPTPSRAYMVIIGELFLNYRSEEHPRRPALETAPAPEQIRVGKEPAGVKPLPGRAVMLSTIQIMETAPTSFSPISLNAQ